MRKRGIATGLRVALVDDHPSILTLFRDILEREGAMIVASCSSAQEGWKAVRLLLPHVCLVDVRMAVGEMLIHRIREARLDTNILVLSAETRPEIVAAVLEDGALGYCLKQSDNDTILGATIAVGVGEPYIDPKLRVSIERVLQNRVRLTPRELAVVAGVARGMNAAGIADRLFVSESTVRKNLHAVNEKLDTTTSAQAVAEAMRRGYLRNIGFDSD